MKTACFLLALPCLLPLPAFAQASQPLYSGGVGDVSAMSTTATGGNRARTLADRAADILNPLDFAGSADPAALVSGTVDAAPAFNAAIASRPSGSALRLVVPAGTYRLDSDVTDGGRIVTIDLSSGAKVGANYGGLGTKVLYVQRVEAKDGEAVRIDSQGIGSSSTVAVIGERRTIVNNGAGNATYGSTTNYLNLNTGLTNANGGDIGNYINCDWRQISGAGVACNWEVAVSPKFTDAEVEAGKNFSMGSREVNVVNNSKATGFSEFNTLSAVPGIGVPSVFTGGYIIATDIWTPGGKFGGHANYALSILGTKESNVRTPAYTPKFYAGLLFGQDSIAPDGRSIFVGGSGSSTVSEHPRTPLAVRYAFARGIDLSEATFDNGQALMLAPDHSVTWGAGNTAASVSTDTSGKMTIAAPGGIDLPKTAWTTFTPTVTPFSGTLAAYTATGRYRRVGEQVYVSIALTITDNGTAAGGLNVHGIPAVGAVPASLSGTEVNSVRSLAAYAPESGTGLLLKFADGSYPGGTNNRLVVNGSYLAQ